MTSPRKPGVAFWATVIAVVLLAYPLSFGPACRLVHEGILPWSILRSVPYRPCFLLAAYGPPPISRFVWEWVGFCGGEWALGFAKADEDLRVPVPYLQLK